MHVTLPGIEKYELEKRLVSSKYGETWKAFDPRTRSYVAIKVVYTPLYNDSQEMEHFRQEAARVAALRHPNIARVHDLFIFPARQPDKQFASMVCIVIDYVEGHSLADYLHHAPHPGKTRPGEELLRLAGPLGDALDYAHEHGVVHANLKPTNIILRGSSEPGQLGQPVLVDFGYINLLQRGGRSSNPFYLSPEQIRDQPATRQSDIYALGVILYEFCTGALPFPGNRPVAIMMQHLNADPTPATLLNATIPSVLSQALARSLQKEPEKRFPSASSFASVLKRSLNQSADVVDVSGMGDGEHAIFPVKDSSHGTSSEAPRTGGNLLFPSITRGGSHWLSSTWYLLIIGMVLLAGLGTVATLLMLPQGHGSAISNAIVGHAFFVSSGQFNGDSPQGINDEVQVNLSNIPAPSAGKSYFAWLLADKSVSESLPVSLGRLSVAQGKVYLFYHGDAQHTNLLGITSRFLITLDDTNHPTMNPLIDTSTWRYYAEIPAVPTPGDKLHFSMLDHLRHLLVESPELSLRGLHGGVAFWFVRNTEMVSELANSARDGWRNNSAKTIRDDIIRILDYLDGIAFAQSNLPAGTPFLADTHTAQIALVGPAPTGTVVPGYTYKDDNSPGYVYLISEHMSGAIASSQTSPEQKQLAIQINKQIDRVKEALEQVYSDARQLLPMSKSQLLQPSTLDILNDLATQAQNAYTGQLDPTTGQSASGALWIYGNLQRLAAFEVRQYDVA